ncbi:MAG: hypothetical protein JWQ28_2387 [Pedobacter sp.]|jgi:hypothetical protein|nr:hypothetical protein [Pedobacter sp.]
MGLIRFIFITIFILWTVRLLLRLVFPLLLKSIFGKMQQSAGQQEQPQQRKKPEGSISIDYMPPLEKKGNADKLGDFVDYEEVK